DAADRVSSTTDAVGNLSADSYDANGNLVQTTSTIAHATDATCSQVCTTTYAYDSDDRLVTTTNPDGTTRANAYDGHGNLVQTTDDAGNAILDSYDDADRPTAIQRSLGTTPATYATTTTSWADEGRA